MASSLVSSVYFPTRPVLGTNGLKVACSSGPADAKLAQAEQTGQTSKVEKELDQALESVDEAAASASPETQAAAQLVRTNICFKRGNAQEAHKSADSALELFANLRDKSGQAKALHAKALAHSMTDEVSHAIRSAQKALAVHKELGDKSSQLFELLVIAQWQLASAKPYASLQTAKQARAIARELGQATSEASALLLMCDSLVRSGRRPQAVTTAKDGLTALKATGDEKGVAAGHNVLLYAFIASDNPLDALDAAQDAIRYVQNLNDKRLEIDVRYMKCQAHLKNKEEEEAAKCIRGAANLARELDDKGEEADALRMLSFALSNMDNLDQEPVVLSEAIEAAEEARSIYKTAELVSGEASAILMLAVLNSQKDEEGVDLVEMVKEAQHLYGEVDDVSGEHYALSLLSDLHVRAGQYSPALEFANSSVDLWTRFGSTKAQAEAMQAVANIYVMMEDFEEAERQIEEAQKLAHDIGAKRLEASLSILLTKVYLEEGANDKDQEESLRLAAMTASEKALAVAGQSGEKDLWAIAMTWRSQVLSWAGRADEAMKVAEKSEKAFEQLADVRNQVRVTIKMAELYRAMGKKTEAKDMANKALNFCSLNTECEGLEKDAQAVLDSMVEKRQVMRSGGGGRMVRKLVKKWRKKGGGGGTVAKPAGLDLKATQEKIKTLVMNVLTEDEDLEPDVPFMEAGVDSLGSVQLVTDVGKAFQMPLAPSIVFDYPTIRVLTEHLVEESASAGGGAASGGGGEDEWEEYEDWDEVFEDGGDDGYMMIEAAPSAPQGAMEVAQVASAAVVAKPKGLDLGATEKKLMELVKNVLTDDEELHADMPFMEAGIDSLGSVQLVTDVGKAFQMPLAPSIVFDYPSVRSLTEHLVEESKG